LDLFTIFSLGPWVSRMRALHRNDSENVPAFACVLAAFALCGPDETQTKVWCLGYVAARIAHSAAYIAANPGLRPPGFVLAHFCLMGMASHVLIALGFV
jgi:glutathione S-transferase